MKDLLLMGPLCLKYKLYKYHLIIFTAVFSFCFVFVCQAQEVAVPATPAAKATNEAIDLTTLGIQIGEKVPDLTINNIHNYKSSTAKLSDFKGKLLILDFWATWCSPCVAMIPKMDSLQKEFGDKIQFLSVTYQKKEEVLSFLENLGKKNGEKYNLPSVVEDNLLRNTFPHRTLPHYVWISGDAEVFAITGLEEITRKKISEVLVGNAQLDRKIDLQRDYNLSELLIKQETPLYFSTLTHFIPGVERKEAFLAGTNDLGPRLIMLNSPITALFAKAYSKGNTFFPNRIILELEDSTKFRTTLSGVNYLKWAEENAYCYEVSIPSSSAENVNELMQRDLKTFFPFYEANVKIVPTRCLALVRINDQDQMRSKGGEVNIAIVSGTGLVANNLPLDNIVYSLNIYFLQNFPLPIIDATDYEHAVDISFGNTLKSVELMNTELGKYGLKFIETTKELEMLIITDKK